MSFLGAILNPINTVLERVLPDKAAQDAAKAKLLEMQLQGELQSVSDQVKVNLAEAQSQSTFVAGWRPAVGWACAIAFAYSYVLQPFLQFLLVAFHSSFDQSKLPVVNISDMMPVLLGMLGLAGMRSYEKVNSASNGH